MEIREASIRRDVSTRKNKYDFLNVEINNNRNINFFFQVLVQILQLFATKRKFRFYKTHMLC